MIVFVYLIAFCLLLFAALLALTMIAVAWEFFRDRRPPRIHP